MFLSQVGLPPIHNPASQPSLHSSGPLTPCPVNHNACNKKTTCSRWAKYSLTCFKGWPKVFINSKTSHLEPTHSNPFKGGSPRISTLLSKAMSCPTLPKHHATTCLPFSVVHQLPAEPSPTQEMFHRSLLGAQKSLKTPPTLQRMQWSIVWLRPNGP